MSLSATKDGLGSWDWGRRAEEEGGGGGGGGGDEVGGGGGGEETGEGNRGWRVFSRWLEKVREAPASPHGNWHTLIFFLKNMNNYKIFFPSAILLS